MIKFVDMFSGIGGFREGLTRAGGFTCVGHCEIDKYANRSYNALFDTKGEWFIEDARKADPCTMPDFQLLCGGFPCQTFSIAGSRKGFGDPRGTLFFELARLAEARKPSYLLFENVPYVQKCIRYRTCIRCSTMAQLSGDCSTPRSTRAKPKPTSFWQWRSRRRASTRSTRSSGKRPSGIIRRSPSAPFCCGWG